MFYFLATCVILFIVCFKIRVDQKEIKKLRKQLEDAQINGLKAKNDIEVVWERNKFAWSVVENYCNKSMNAAFKINKLQNQLDIAHEETKNLEYQLNDALKQVDKFQTVWRETHPVW